MQSRNVLYNLFIMLCICLFITLAGFLFRRLGFPETNIVVIYIMAVFLTARFTGGYFYGVVSSVLSLLCFNYFFTVPYHTLAVDDPGYLITFGIMLTTSLLTSAMTSKEKQMTREANIRNEESRILYRFTSRLSDAFDIESVFIVIIDTVYNLFDADCGCIYAGQLDKNVFLQGVKGEIIHRTAFDKQEIKQRFNGLREEYIHEDNVYSFGINGKKGLMAVVNICDNVDIVNRKSLLHSILENAAMALERIEISTEQLIDHEKLEQEKERANLLRAISHDLRTPLSGIMGTSEMLMDMTDKDDSRQELLRGIYSDADWLKTMVENILSLTRIQDKKMLVNKESEAIEEIISSAVSRIEKSYPDRSINVVIPEEFHLVPMDGRLIEQVLINLLSNAVKHTKRDEDITIKVDYSNDTVRVMVIDSGEGIAKEDMGHIFETFYTSKVRSSDVKKGIGIGLTICDTIIKAHSGKIYANNRKDSKGAGFTFELPLQEK